MYSATISSSSLVVAGCGGGSENQENGFPSSYVGPKPNYEAPTVSDPYFETLKPSHIQPYWVSSLTEVKSHYHDYCPRHYENNNAPVSCTDQIDP